MTAYDFTLVVDRDATDEQVNALFEIDQGDSTPEGGPHGPNLVHVTREADTLAEAIGEAVHNVESVGLQVVGVQTDDLVSGKDIAARLNRTYEGVRKWVTGERGPGNFPAAVSDGQWALYSWVEVVDWLRDNRIFPSASVNDHDRKIAAANHLLRGRHLARADERAQLAQLITA